MKMSCRDIEEGLYYGPVIMKSVHCTQSFVFQRDCHELVNMKIKSTGIKSSVNVTLHVEQIVLCVLIILGLIFSILWIVRVNKGVKTQTGYLKLSRKGCFYITKYDEWYNEEGEQVIGLLGKESVLNATKREVKISLWKMMFLILLCRPISVDSYEVLSFFDSTFLKYSYVIEMMDSEVINLSSTEISRGKVIHTAQLSPMFQTADWRLHPKEEYFCQWYKCEAFSTCGLSAIPFIEAGTKADELFHYKKLHNGY